MFEIDAAMCQNACRQHIYQVLPMNGVDRHLPANHPPQPPLRNASLAGNGHDRIHQQPDGTVIKYCAVVCVESVYSECSFSGTSCAVDDV